jgi:adenylate cyclase
LTSSSAMPSWPSGARRAALRTLPLRLAGQPSPSSARAADNKRRIAAGLNPVRIRMGIHIGPVIVGDIGALNRINYTIVGDVVNATQRLESLGKAIGPDAEATAFVSEEIFAAVPDGFQFVERGAHFVKGKQESLKVFQLIGAQKGGSRSG